MMALIIYFQDGVVLRLPHFVHAQLLHQLPLVLCGQQRSLGGDQERAPGGEKKALRGLCKKSLLGKNWNKSTTD